MHHIKNDRRTLQSADLLYQGLLACLKEKLLAEVTVTDLQRASGVARSTFYRSFDDVSDVLAWQCDLGFHEALCGWRPPEFTGELDLARHFFSHWASHSEVLELLIRANRHDIVYGSHLRNAALLERRYGELPGLPRDQRRYFMAIRTGVLIGVLTAWLDGGRRESADELVGIVGDQLQMMVASK